MDMLVKCGASLCAMKDSSHRSSCTDSMQWQSFLLQYGSYSGGLREAMAMLTCLAKWCG